MKKLNHAIERKRPMKTPSFFCWFLISSLGLSVAVASPMAASGTPAEIETVLQFERDWCNAYLRADTDFLQQHVVDDFTLTNSNAQVGTKAEDIQDLKSGNVKFSVFENREMKARIYGDTAVVTGWTKVEGVVAGKPYKTDVAFTDTLTRIKGQWYGVAGHVSKPNK
jgi:ketosteroid isomerase-like protein